MEIKASFAMALGLFIGFNMGLSSVAFADASLWQDIKPFSEKETEQKTEKITGKTTQQLSEKNNGLNVKSTELAYQKARLLHLDMQQMTARLDSNILARKGLSSQLNIQPQKPIKVDLPLPNGKTITVSAVIDNILPTSLLDKFPQIKTFKVLPDTLIASGKLDITAKGFHALLLTRQGESIFIDPVENTTYASYKKSDQENKGGKSFSCGASVEESHYESFDRNLDESIDEDIKKKATEKLLQSKASALAYKTTNSLLTYRIAVAATGEYTAKHGGTVAGALSAISTTINRVNQVFEQDLGIRLVLVNNNDKLIYTDANNDPYSGSDSKALIYQNQDNIDALIGTENYDVGHLFTASGGGLAGIASACNRYRKSQGVSGISNPRNDSFNLDFVAHEIGHQFGATHTFNGLQGLCSGNTREAKTAFEPGSGSTVMSYAGYCGQDNLQSNTDAMFHIGSVRQIRSYMMLDQNSACGSYDNQANKPPVVDAGKNYTIPAQTPFELIGEASDPDGDSLLSAWQQVDFGEVSPVNIDTANNALFRVHPLSSEMNRSFPPINNIINHSFTRGESLPIQQRLMRFRFVVQDSHNSTQSDTMNVQVQRTGSRFALHLPRSQYSLGDTHKILWNVASTEVAPVNCQNVDISLSVDGGYHFTKNLGESVPNTGEAWVTIPSSSPSTTRGRFKISCSDNVFFAVSYRDFSVNNKNHLERVVLADEDQPEKDLEDFDLTKIDYSKYADLAQTESGGGTLVWIMTVLFLVGFRRFRKA